MCLTRKIMMIIRLIKLHTIVVVHHLQVLNYFYRGFGKNLFTLRIHNFNIIDVVCWNKKKTSYLDFQIEVYDFEWFCKNKSSSYMM